MVTELKKLLKSSKPITGVDAVLKKLKKGEVQEVFIALNCPKKDEVLRLCKIMKVKCDELKENNVELAVICKRSHSVSALAFLVNS